MERQYLRGLGEKPSHVLVIGRALGKIEERRRTEFLLVRSKVVDSVKANDSVPAGKGEFLE